MLEVGNEVLNEEKGARRKKGILVNLGKEVLR